MEPILDFAGVGTIGNCIALDAGCEF